MAALSWVVRWYCRDGSYGELEDMLCERGADVDHGTLKRLIKPMLGFKSMKTAYATIMRFEVMRALKKRQANGFNFSGNIKGEIRLKVA